MFDLRLRPFGLNIGLAACFGLFSGAYGTACAAMDLEQAFARVMQSSPRISLAKANEQESAGLLNQANGAFDWRLNVGADAVNRAFPVTRDGFLTAEDDKELVFESQVSVSKRFRNGIVVSPGVVGVANAPNTASTAFGHAETAPRLSVTVPLMRGGGRSKYSVAVDVAKLGRRASALRGLRVRSELLGETAITYWQCLGAVKRYEILKGSNERAAASNATLRQQIQSGVFPIDRLKVAEADFALKKISENSAHANAAKVCENLRAKLSLRQMPPALSEHLPAVSPLIATDSRSYLEQAVALRVDLKALNLEFQQSQLGLEQVEDENMPALDFSFGLDRAGVNLEIPLGGQTGEGRLTSQGARIERARLNLEMARNAVIQEVNEAFIEIRRRLAAHQSASQSAKLLREVAQSLETQARQDEAGFDELLAIDEKLVRAELEAQAAQTGYAVALARLITAMGLVDEAGGVIQSGKMAGYFRQLPPIEARQ